jgi:hypothetical protein
MASRPTVVAARPLRTFPNHEDLEEDEDHEERITPSTEIWNRKTMKTR